MSASPTSKAVASETTKAAKRMIIFGGNGYVGSHVAKAAISRGWDVVVACRSAKPVAPEPWNACAQFVRIDALNRPDVYRFLEDFDSPETTAIVNCIGLLTLDHHKGRQVNGEPMRNIAAALYEKKMPHLQHCVYISANKMFPASLLLRGYYDGKTSAERSLSGDSGLGTAATALNGASYSILRPSFVYGWRAINERTSIPLGAAGWPLDLALSPLSRLVPSMNNTALAPPVSVDAVARAAVATCELPSDEKYKNKILEVADIKEAAARLESIRS